MGVDLVAAADPGASGGVAIIQHGEVVLAERMPMVPVEGDHRKRAFVDAWRVREWIAERIGSKREQAIFAVEDCWGMRRDSSKGAFSFGGTFYALLIAAHGLVDVELVPPKTWQKAILRPPHVTIRRSDFDENRPFNKAAAIDYCKNRWPRADLSPKPCRSPQSGIADALCLASHCWNVYNDIDVDAPKKTQKRKKRGMRT